METTCAIRAVSKQLWYALRCHWCEVLATWSLKAAPPGYVPSYVEVVIAAAKGGVPAVEQIASQLKRSSP